MKKNSVKIILVFLVLLVWGVVFYRLFSSVEKAEIASYKPKVITSKKIDVKLSLNYKDPFKIKHKQNPIITKEVAPEEPPTFIYKGLISGVKSTLIIVENNGVSEIIELSDSLLGFRILKINNDSMIVRKKGTRYNLIKN